MHEINTITHIQTNINTYNMEYPDSLTAAYESEEVEEIVSRSGPNKKTTPRKKIVSRSEASTTIFSDTISKLFTGSVSG